MLQKSKILPTGTGVLKFRPFPKSLSRTKTSILHIDRKHSTVQHILH